MGRKVFITGLGTLSAIGLNKTESFSSLKHNISGIGPLRNINTILDHLPVGEVSLSNTELMRLTRTDKKMAYSRTDLMGMIAAEEALNDANILDINEYKTGLVSANSVGGMGYTELNWKAYQDRSFKGQELDLINSHDTGYSTEKIANLLGITDYLTTISTACSSSTNAIMLGTRLIQKGVVDRVVAGGTDALSKFTLNGFNTLMILDENICKPFDKNRKGLNLGEGAGYVVLESEKSVKGKNIYCEVLGYANSNDAYHQTASSPDGEGAFLAMTKALEVANLSPDQVSYINAHGTGTHINDLSEGTAIQRVFGENIPPTSSTKPYTGHTLGACGGIEAVFSALAIQNDIAYANLNYKTQMDELSFEPIRTNDSSKKIDVVLSNSFGFGGNTSSLILSSIH